MRPWCVRARGRRTFNLCSYSTVFTSTSRFAILARTRTSIGSIILAIHFCVADYMYVAILECSLLSQGFAMAAGARLAV